MSIKKRKKSNYIIYKFYILISSLDRMEENTMKKIFLISGLTFIIITFLLAFLYLFNVKVIRLEYCVISSFICIILFLFYRIAKK